MPDSQLDLEPRRDVQPHVESKTPVNTVDADEAAPAAHPTLRHPTAAAHRAAAMRKLQRNIGNRAARSAFRKPEPPKSEATKKRDTERADHKTTHSNRETPPQTHHTAHAGSKAAQSVPTPIPSAAADHHATEESTSEPQSTLPPPVTDAEAVATLRAEWNQPAPLLDPDPLAIPFDGAPHLNLRLAPTSKTDTSDHKPADPHNAIQEATSAFAHLNGEASRGHREVLDRANEIRRDLSMRARQSTHEIESSLEGALDAAIHSIDANRQLLLSASVNALQSLDQQHRAARVALAGAAGAARKSVASARASVDKGIDEIQKDILKRFKDVYDAKADALEKSTNESTKTLRSADEKTRVANQFTGFAGVAAGLQLAQEEAQQAAVPPLLDNLAGSIDKSSAEQAKTLRNILTYPQKDGSTIESIVKKFTQSLKEAAVGGGKPAPPAPAASGKPAKKQEPLYDQASHAVDSAFFQSSRALEQRFEAARDAITHYCESALQQLAAQRSAIFAQLSAIRNAHLDAVRRASQTGIRSIDDGTKTALPAYSDATRRSTKSLENAALRGADPLQRVAREGLTGAEKSLNDGRAYQLRRLDQVATGASSSIDRQPQEASTAVAKTNTGFDTDLTAIAASISKNMLDVAAQQSEGIKEMARSVAGSASVFTKPLPVLFKKAVDEQKALWFPDPPKPEPKDPKTKSPEEVYAEIAKDPKPKIEEPVNKIATQLTTKLTNRAGAAFRALHKFNLDEDGLLAALRGITQKQGLAISALYLDVSSGESLEGKIYYEYDRHFVGLNKNEYNAAINYLHGHNTEGALAELRETKGWFSTDSKRADQIMRDLTREERKQLVKSPEWKEVSKEVEGGLHGVDLDVFKALEESNFAVANALRAKEAADRARENNDMDAYFRAIQNYNPPGTDREDQSVKFEDFRHAFVGLIGPPKPGEEKASDTERFKIYLTRDVTVDMPDGDGGSYPVTYKVEGPDRALAETLAIKGPGSIEARGARVLRETERKEGKPDLPELENAVVDPRLNPALHPELTADDRKRIREQDQDKVFLAYIKLAHDYGFKDVTATDAQTARYQAAVKLRSKYDTDSEKGMAGATYAASIVTDDVPDAAAGLRYAILGIGTDEDLVHRNLQRLSKAGVDSARATYKSRYGDDLDEDLGTYGRSTFGDLSGDDRLQAEREMLGVPQNDKERLELSLYTIQQQEEDTGVAGKSYNEGSQEERAMSATKRNLLKAAGGIVMRDQYGRPMVIGGHFDASGKYTGANINLLNLDMDLASVTAQNYAARVDDLASLVTTAIAIAGAVAAAVVTVVTGGAASPLLMAAIAGVSGALAIGANELIKGGRYGWEQAALDLGMTGVQMISAGVGQSLALAARGGSAAVAAGMRSLVVQNLPKEMTRLAGSQFANMILMGAVTGGINGLGGALLNEQTWAKGLGEGIREAMLGMVKGALAGSVTSAVTSTLDQSKFFGQKLQELSAEGGLIKGGINVIGRSLGRSAISATGAVAGRGAELAFDAGTGKFHGNLHDALSSLAEAGREAGIRGVFEGAGEAVGKRYENRIEAAKLQAAQNERTTLTPVPGAEPLRAPARFDEALETPKFQPAHADESIRASIPHPQAEEGRIVLETAQKGPDGEPVKVKVRIELVDSLPAEKGVQPVAMFESEGPDTYVIRVSKSAPPAAVDRALANEFAEIRALHGLGTEARGTPLGAEQPGTPSAHDEARRAELDVLLKKANVDTPEGRRALTEAGRLAENLGIDASEARRVLRIDEQAAAGIAGSRSTGDAAARFGLRPATGNTLENALNNLVEQGGPASRYAKRSEDGHIELETRQTVEGEAVKVKVRVELVESLPLDEGVMPVAMFESEGANAYVIRVSKGAPASSVERALAHELAEIRAVHGAVDIEQQHALAPGSKATKLSPHDEGRLAELDVLIKQSNLETPEGRRAFDEAQRLAAHLGLTGEGEPAAARRALALKNLPESTAKFLSSAIEAAADNPFLKPLTGNLRSDLALLGKHLQLAQLLGELSADPKSWLPDVSLGRRGNPIAVEAAEQIRQMLIRDEVVSLKYKQFGAHDPRIAQTYREILPPELQRIFTFALDRAAEPESHRLAILESQLDQNTIAATRARFGDIDKFQDWPAYKAKYLAANPSLEHESIPGEFANPKSLRNAFDNWARGRYIPEGGGRSRSLFDEVKGPTPGYEARFLKDPEGMQSLVLSKQVVVVEGKNQRVVAIDDAIAERNKLLSDAGKLHAQAERAEKLGDVDSAERLTAAADELSQKVRPLSEAFGVVAGRAAAAKLFSGGLIFEFHGPGVPDLLILLPDGTVAIIECKGGGADLGQRTTTDGKLRVQQGTREYAETIAEVMLDSSDSQVRDLGAKLLLQLADPKFDLKYYLVKQDFQNGKPLPPEVKQFDTAPREPSPAAPDQTNPATTPQPGNPDNMDESK
jgi:hypothetical protein